MKIRFMRVIVFYDLPTLSESDVKIYSQFRKQLLKEGFVMMQQSVYSKLTMNQTHTDYVKKRIYDIAPAKGLVQIMAISENQYQAIEFITGEKQTTTVDSREGLIRL